MNGLENQIKQNRRFDDKTYYFKEKKISVNYLTQEGSSDPSTMNLMALAKLFNMTPEELLKEVQ